MNLTFNKILYKMTQTNVPTELKTLKILHLALLMGPTLFLLISLFLVSTGSMGVGLEMYTDQIFIAMLIVAIIVVLFSRYNFNKSLEALKSNGLSPEDNMQKYRGSLIARWATVEFAELLSIIFFLLTRNYYLIILVVILLIYFFTIRPTEENGK